MLATHRDLGRTLRRSGFRVRTLPVPPRVDLPALRRMVDRRLAWARRAEGPLPRITDETLRALLDRHGADLRAVMGALYDRVQRMDERARRTSPPSIHPAAPGEAFP